jgi:hypothetical protein
VIEDRAGQVWYDPEGSTYPALLLVLGGYEPTEFQSDEPGSVYHHVLMLYSGIVNGWRETPSEPWEMQEHMKRLL